MMLNEATRQFVCEHGDDDVRLLALQARALPDVDLPTALDQIRGRQTARQKLPSWAATDGIVYPPHLSMEQCSSEQTARYKAQLLARLLQSNFPMESAKNTKNRLLTTASHAYRWFIDLTGGFGIDFVAMAQAVSGFFGEENASNSSNRQTRCIYVEQNEHLCDLARHNFPLLGLPNAEIVCDTAENFLKKPSSFLAPPSSKLENFLKKASSLLAPPSSKIFFLDPARRDGHGNRTYALADCSPNVLEIRDELLKIADFIVLKLSPMLDWHRAVEELKTVSEVHIVSVANECKELLLVLKNEGLDDEKRSPLQVFCVNDRQQFSYEVGNVENRDFFVAETDFFDKKHLFVPNASVMKAGCFAELCERFQLAALAPNSHLFVSNEKTEKSPISSGGIDEKMHHFPGKIFQISAISSMNKRDLREKLRGMAQANIAVRNFPMKPEELRRRLKLREGGDNYLFATTLANGKHVLILCEHLV